MFKRLKILTLLQLSNKTKLYGKHSKRIYAHIALRAFMIVVISVVMSVVLHFIKNLIYIPVNDYFLIFILILTQFMSIISAISNLGTDLYRSKDNQILLALPVKNDEVFLSKIVVYYINESIRNLFLLLPLLIGFGFVNKMAFWYYLNILPMLILLPLISISLSAFLTIPVTLVKNFLKTRNLLSVFLMLVAAGFAFFVVYKAIGLIETPIRIVQLYNRFVISISLFMQKVASFGLIYTSIGKLLSGSNVFINYIVIIITATALFGLNILISRPMYYKLVSSSSENVVVKKHKNTSRPSKNIYFTFLKKELIIAKRSPNELLNNYAVLMSLPFFMYVLNYIYMGMNRSSLGNQFVLICNVLISLLLVTGSNAASATAITTEGYEFVLLKTAPSNTMQIAWAKITFNTIVVTTMIFFSFLLFQIALPVFDRRDIWSLFSVVVLVNTTHILWSFQMDVLYPKLSDYAATGSLSNNENISKSISNGLGLSTIFTLLSAILFLSMPDLAWIILIGTAAILLILRFRSFGQYLKAYFEDIEY